MPFRFRKSIKLGPVKVNVGKKGISSVSTGGKYLRTTFGRGRRTTSVNLPGGLSYQKTASTRSTAAEPPRRKRRWWLLWLM